MTEAETTLTEEDIVPDNQAPIEKILRELNSGTITRLEPVQYNGKPSIGVGYVIPNNGGILESRTVISRNDLEIMRRVSNQSDCSGRTKQNVAEMSTFEKACYGHGIERFVAKVSMLRYVH